MKYTIKNFIKDFPDYMLRLLIRLGMHGRLTKARMQREVEATNLIELW